MSTTQKKSQEDVFSQLMRLYTRRDYLAATYHREPTIDGLTELTDIWGKIYALRWALGKDVRWGVGEPKEELSLVDWLDKPTAPTPANYFTEYSSEPHHEDSVIEALTILDDAKANAASLSDEDMYRMIDMAVQKLRPVSAPAHDAAALAQLEQQYPSQLPWMQVAVGIPSNPTTCSPLSCDGCVTCDPR